MNKIKSASIFIKLSIFFISVLTFLNSSSFADIFTDQIEIIVSNAPNFIAGNEFCPGKDLLYLRLTDKTKANNGTIDNMSVRLISAQGADSEDVDLTETGENTGIFQAAKGIIIVSARPIIQDATLQVAATSDTITIVYNLNSRSRVLATLNTLSEVNNLSVNPDSLLQTAGKPFKVEITARDARGNIVSGYCGTVNLEINYISPKIGTKNISPQNTANFFNGKAEIFATYSDAGIIKIIAKDKNNLFGESSPITFLPARFKLGAQAKQVAGKPFNLTISALNQNNEIVSNYENPAFVMMYLSPKIISKKKIKFDKGVAIVDIVYNNWGEKRFMACDEKYPDVCGISERIFFGPYRFGIEVVAPPAGRDKFYLEELFNGKVTVYDYQGYKISDYAGVVAFKSDKEVALPDKYFFDWRYQGRANFSISASTEEPFRIEVYDEQFPQAKGESKIIQTLSARVKLEKISQKGGKAILRIKIEDKNGKVIVRDNSTIFTVRFFESLPDNSASLTGEEKVTAKRGIADIVIIDSQSETVIVNVEPEPYLEAEPLDITFR
ncbi:MAG: hypothetical protein Q8L26_09380 [Candidatus Omnitrophota bacterium]|nr:hypothetical protein [Candidatus Omnitrophota bacterium]